MMLVTSLIYASIKEKLKAHKIKESIETILLDARFLKLHKVRNTWKVENICKNHYKIFEEFGLDVFEEANTLK